MYRCGVAREQEVKARAAVDGDSDVEGLEPEWDPAEDQSSYLDVKA